MLRANCICGPHDCERIGTISKLLKTREDTINQLRERPEISVLVVGAGINGASVFRELALHGFDALIVDRGDFACGTTAAPSRMIHAGLRYLEFGEKKLVSEGVHERNLLLQNCPHYIFPLPTTIPFQSRWSGMMGVIRKTLGLSPGKRAKHRGARMIGVGLRMYDKFAEHNRQMPKHHFTSRAEAFKRRPGLHPDTIGTATYYDGWISYPERLCMEVITDAEAACESARALNYVSARGARGDTVTLRDEIAGQDIQVRPKVVVNAAGAWIDFANESLGHPSKLIAGTKGAHLVLENDELMKALDGEMLFYETPDGRAVVALPWLGKPLIGSTDIAVDDPDQARCDDNEIDYMIECLTHLLPDVKVDRSQILSTFSGVRPLMAKAAETTGQMSRSHFTDISEPTESADFPVFSLVGGKWTPFRAFGEQAMDKLLAHFSAERKVCTESIPIGGGREFPRTDLDRTGWIEALAGTSGLAPERIDTLLVRYGTVARQVAEFCTADDDKLLNNHPTYTQREIEYIIRNERVVHLNDLLLRRTAIALLGELTDELLDELLAIFASLHELSDNQTAAERKRTTDILRNRHHIDLT
ncbi:MAG: glycerol-3-phosphate dehydrogenase/oxidase [Phycisphaerae bacterium]|nr:glycerol-3-phosphate dehydrogenase/oxidase [Phycisphaerae bacterium]